MNQYFADKKFILRFLLDDKPSQTKVVREYFKKAKSKEISIYVPIAVFVEVDYELIKLYKLPKVEVAKKLIDIANVSYLDIEKRDIIRKALEIYQEKSLDLVDFILYFEAQQTGRTLLTFDKKLKKLSL